MPFKINPFTGQLDYYDIGSGGGTTVTITHVANYTALPDPTTVGLDEIYITDAAQGTSWLPGTLGGTYYPAGTYFSNGTVWIYSVSPYQATQAEVNTGTNNDKFVTPETLNNYSGWTKSKVHLGNVDNTSDINKPISTDTQNALDLKADLVGGTVPSSQLPSYVDDVIEGYYSTGVFYSDAGLTTPIVPTTGKIYVDLLQNKSYRWTGSVYISISNPISSIDELTDVTIASVTNGQVLQYNLTASQWENKTITVGNGDMQKSTYDIDNDGIVDFAETVPVTVRNPSISTILRKGTIVYLNGSTGWRPNAYKAQANAEATSSGTFGVVLSDIATNSDGTVAMLGTIHTLDTSDTAPYPFTADVLVDGDALWLDPNNAGYVTKIKPQAPNHIVFIGVVARAHPSLGRIVYRITNGYELDELHNVFINGTLANNHTLYYDSATSLWKTNTITNVLGYTPVPNTRTVNGYPLSTDVSLGKSDIGLSNVLDIDTSNPANIVQTATYRFVTDTEKATWNSKQNALGYTPANKAGDTFTGAISATNLSGTNTGDQDLSGLVIKNSPITGATKTKITYDSKGLVTAGSDATTSDIVDSTNSRYVTDVEKTKIGFLSSVVSDVQNQLNNKINSNTAIVAGTGTKITYDAKGLILSSTSATTDDIADTTNKRYTTDAQQTILGNTSNINSGDETTATIKTKLGAATTALDGYLTEADWNTFYGKQDSLGYTPVNKAGDTMSSYLILNADPVNSLGAATKQYVDNLASGINFHEPAHAATTSNLVANYTNGTGGVNAKLISTSNGALIVDNHTVLQFERLLVWQQTNGFENGIYVVSETGDSTHPFELTRATDADNNPVGEIQYGDFLFIQKGDTYGGYGFIVNTAGTINIGSTNISYVQFNAAQVVAAGYGLQELTPNALSVDTSLIQTKLSAATSSVNGYLTSTDWGIFNGKQDAISLTTLGTGPATLIGNTLNIPTPSSGTFASLTTTGSSGASSLISGVLNVPTYSLAGLGGEPTISSGTASEYWRGDKTWQTFPTIPSVGTWGALNYPSWISGTPFVKMTAAGTFSLDTNTYLTNAVTSVSSLTIGTTGTDLSSSVANDTTTPVITLNVPTASATNRGALSSTDWSTFNGKQDYLTIGDITDVGTDGISITGGTGAIIGSGVSISQQVANATQNGYLSAADWASFNSAAPTFIPKLSANETYRGITINNNSTTVVSEGGITMTSSASTLAQAVASTNFATKQIRLRYYASTVAGGRYTGTRGSALLWYIHGGFRYVCDFNISDTAYSANCQQFYGLAGQNTDLSYGTATGILVSTLTNIIGVGSETGDTNLQVFHNSASGTATKIDLGANFPSNRTAGAISTTVYSIQLYNEPLSTDVKYEVKNNETGDVANGTITTNLPLSSQALNFFASRCMSTTSVTNTGQFDLMKLGVYSQF